MFGTRASRIRTTALFLGLLGASTAAPAVIAEVRDEAQFFSRDAVAQANETIKDIKQRYKKDLLIETVRRVPESKQDEANSSDPKTKAHFFANWAVERAKMEGVNGIYVLITREPGHVEVAVGNQTHAMFSNEERHRLSELLLTHFRRKEYDEGLLAAVKDVRSVLAIAPASGRAVVPPTNRNLPAPHRPAPPAGPGGAVSGSGIRWLAIGLVVLLGIGILSAIMRAASSNQPRPVGPGFGGPGGMGAPYGGYGGYGTGGGGFFSSLMGGLFGAAAGNWLYDQFSGGQSHLGGYGHMGASPTIGSAPDTQDTDYTAEGGDFDQAEANDDRGSFGDDNSSWGGGGDFGGAGGGGGDFGGGGDAGSGGDF